MLTQNIEHYHLNLCFILKILKYLFVKITENLNQLI